MTCVPAVRVRPTPPAIRLHTATRQQWSVWKRSTAVSRSSAVLSPEIVTQASPNVFLCFASPSLKEVKTMGASVRRALKTIWTSALFRPVEGVHGEGLD
jgi:hypothetical protein